MDTHVSRSHGGFDAAARRAGTFLSGLLPGVLPALLSLTLLLAIAPSAGAQNAAGSNAAGMQKMINEQLAQIPSGEEGVNQIMGELTERLTLSGEQQKEIRPTIVDTVASMEKSRDSFKAGELTPMAMAMQLQMAGQKAAVLIEPVLDESQQVTYKAMRQEQRRQMMQAMQRQRAASTSSGSPSAPSAGGSQ